MDTKARPMDGVGALAAVFAAALACFMALGSVLPILPRYIHGPLESGDVAVGIVVGAFAITAIVARPWAGRESDRRGRRDVLAGGAAFAAVGGALLFLPLDVPGLVFARLVVGVGEGVVFTVGAAWVLDLAPPDRRGRMIGLFGLSVWGGVSAGPVIGEALHSLGGYDAVWAFAALAPLVGAAIVLSRPRDTPPALLGEPAAGERADGLFAREAVGPGIALALVNIGYATMAGFVVLHLEEQDTGHGVLAFTAFATSVVATRLLLGSIPDILGPRRAAVIAAVAEGVGLVIVALAGAWPVAVAGALVMGFGFSMLYPALALFVVNAVGERRRGVALGTFTAFFDIGIGLGGPIAGAIAALGGYPLAFCVAAGLALAAAAIAARLALPVRVAG